MDCDVIDLFQALQVCFLTGRVAGGATIFPILQGACFVLPHLVRLFKKLDQHDSAGESCVVSVVCDEDSRHIEACGERLGSGLVLPSCHCCSIPRVVSSSKRVHRLFLVLVDAAFL